MPASFSLQNVYSASTQFLGMLVGSFGCIDDCLAASLNGGDQLDRVLSASLLEADTCFRAVEWAVVSFLRGVIGRAAFMVVSTGKIVISH